MSHFVTLIRYTQQGVAKIKESPARLDAAKKAAEKAGGKIHAWYLTMGKYDAVIISEFPNDEASAKFMLATGALGTLGVITRANFRLHPLPRNIRSFTFAARDLGDASRVVLAVQDSWLTPTGLQARFTAGAAPAVDVRFEGTDAGLAAQALALRKLAAPAAETATSDAVWQAREELWSSAESAAIAKFSVLPASVAETCGRIGHLADALGVQWRAVVQGTGLGWLRLEGSSAPAIHQLLHTLRPELERVGGSLAVLHRPAAVPAIDAWGSGGDAFPLMLSVKQQFDPRGTLNPGRFIGGI